VKLGYRLAVATPTVALAACSCASAAPMSGRRRTSSDGIASGNSTVGTISSTGLFTPGTEVGTHNIVATSTANTSVSGSAVVAVTNLAGVYTYHNDIARDGANAQEYALTTANVNTLNFGKLFSCTADGAIYGQPLWVANLTVNGAPQGQGITFTPAGGGSGSGSSSGGTPSWEWAVIAIVVVVAAVAVVAALALRKRS